MGFLWFLFLFFISKVIFNTTDLPLPPTSNKIKGFPLPNRLLTFTFQFSVFKFLSLREKEAIFHPESVSESKKKKDFSLSLSLSLSLRVKKQQSLNPRRRRKKGRFLSLSLRERATIGFGLLGSLQLNHKRKPTFRVSFYCCISL